MNTFLLLNTTKRLEVSTKLMFSYCQVLMQNDPSLLHENGGQIKLNPTWAKSFLKRMGLRSKDWIFKLSYFIINYFIMIMHMTMLPLNGLKGQKIFSFGTFAQKSWIRTVLSRLPVTRRWALSCMHTTWLLWELEKSLSIDEIEINSAFLQFHKNILF